MESHLPTLISDLALILIMAAVTTLIFKKLKQPLVLGYIIAGFIVSPYLAFTPNVADEHSVEIWAEIGVIFLLFSLGLEFSFKKLMRVGGSASITAIFEIVCITLLGFFTGKVLGWKTMDCLFLGGMLASSSTTIIIRAFEELGLKSRHYVKTVFGILVVEDIVVILLMVLLSTVAVTQHVGSGEMIYTVLKLVFFLILWFLMGIFVIPTLLKKAKKLLDDEVYLILSIGLCLGMVVIATQVGFSAELGAFIMGSILAETTSAEKIEHIFKSVKDLFGAIFFVSIGMMINPSVIVEYGWVVLLITLIVVFGKFIATALGALLSGQPLKQAIEVGMSMAQIGEFAFIVATLGLSLGVISDFLFPVAVGTAAITTFTTPYMIKYSDKVYLLIEKILPKKWLEYINAYSSRAEMPKTETDTRKLLRKLSITVVVNAIIIISIIVLCTIFLLPALDKTMDGILPNIITLAAGLLLSLPFLWGLIFDNPSDMSGLKLLKSEIYNRRTLLIVEIARMLIGLILVTYLADVCIGTKLTFLIFLPLLLIILIFLFKKIKNIYKSIEKRFMQNLHGREIAAAEQQAPMSNIRRRLHSRNPALTDWDVHLTDLEVPQHARYIGRMLRELEWREKFGINVVYIKRGEHIIYAPGPNSKIMPFDHIGVFTTDDILEKFKPAFQAEQKIQHDYDLEDIVVEKICIDFDNPLLGKSIKNSGIREQTGGMVMAIERINNRILAPDPKLVFQEMDIAWIVGEKKRLKKLKTLA
ncbi:MAG: cation:proton antiporter [Prevotellaceae bacterium]|jgi:CPA2 family monovalent cation:H+ antiporter-2|nr:cation:proton antiporter [Prevotellaceae bacterium]